MRITAICNTPRGILTAADGKCNPFLHKQINLVSDLLVKMWSTEGHIIGVLKQNVLSGVKSPTWNLTFDVEPYLTKEEQNVSEILSDVNALDDIQISNDLDNYELSLQYSNTHSAIFARSELRKRIDLSSKILALNFAHSETYSPTRLSHTNAFEDRSLGSLAESIGSSQSKASKSSAQALADLRSTDDQLSSSSNLSLDQRRRKQKTLNAVGEHYLKKNGVILPLVGKGKALNSVEPKIFEWEKNERRVTKALAKTASLFLLPKTSSASATMQAIDDKCAKHAGRAFEDLNDALKGIT